MGDLFALVRLPDHPAADANSIATAVPTAGEFHQFSNIKGLSDIAYYNSMTDEDFES
jgi:hypothetical protein